MSILNRPFELSAPYKPTGDQPKAIASLTENIQKGCKNQILLGVTGSGKTFTMANVIANLQRPTLVMAHNKTLAAQLFSEFREFFPNNSVQYFVSYYDYYQPEAYIPSSDTYIEKESTINEEIEKFRHATTHALLTRRDTIIVASVSCIYGLGSPDIYKQSNIKLKVGDSISRQQILRRLTDIQYERNDIDLRRGRFMVKGERLIIFPAYEEYQFRITQFGDEIEALELIDPVSGEVIEKVNELEIFPAKHYLTDDHQRLDILKEIQDDMYREVASLEAKGKLVEAQRLRQRTMFDIEMIQETGSVAGIENYSRYFDRRQSGSPPSVLLDYFPADYLLMIDESHMTVPQISGMYHGDRSRKQTLVDFGFRLEAAKDNRPLTFAEFEERRGQTVFVSATPGPFEREQIDQEGRRLRLETGSTPNLIVEQLIRPTGILDPQVEVRPTEGQVKDLLGEIEKRVLLQERVLVTTLTKRMSEDLNMYLLEKGVKVQYLHSDVETIERSNILRDLRLGVYDVIVGINLLREGLDLPEVSLVAILDADKEGFLRSDTALIQTIGRAARHPDGKVIMYADRITGSMQRAIAETERRREIQEAYNSQHGIVPQRMVKSISTALPTRADLEARDATAEYHNMSAKERAIFLDELREKMRQAALQLDYEQAAELRDQIRNLQR